MSFNFEPTDVDFGITSLENIFVSEYLPLANEIQLKVYITGIKMAQSRSYMSNEDLAKELNLSIEQVHSAWDFWEEKSLIKKIDYKKNDLYSVIFVSLRNSIATSIYSKNNKVLSTSTITPSPSDNSYDELYEAIDAITLHSLTPPQKIELSKWIKKIPHEIILYGFEYCYINLSKKNFYFAKKVIHDWYNRGLLSRDDVINDIEKFSEINKLYKNIYKNLGISSPITEGSKQIINKWINEYKIDEDFLLFMITEFSKSTTNVNFNYLDSRIEDSFLKRKIKSVNEFNKVFNKKENKDNKSFSNKKNKFHNFNNQSGYSIEEINELLGV